MTIQNLRKNLKIVIKTKDRIKKLRNKTYNKIILKYGLNEKNVHLFVSDDNDYEKYSAAYTKCKVIKGPPGIAAIDNFIVEYFKQGEIYLYMNDDISGFKKATNPKTIRDVSKPEFYKILQKMINECMKYGFTYGGFYPVPNPYFMYNGTKGKEIRYDLCMVMDPLSICINNKTVKLTTIKVKKPDGSIFSGESSDAEKCILHYKDRGGLVRFNQYAAIVEYYGKQGGYQGRNNFTEDYTAKEMMKLYPNYVKGINYKKNGNTSLKLNPNPNVKITNQKISNSDMLQLKSKTMKTKKRKSPLKKRKSPLKKRKSPTKKRKSRKD